jgi:hypothetical protein
MSNVARLTRPETEQAPVERGAAPAIVVDGLVTHYG